MKRALTVTTLAFVLSLPLSAGVVYEIEVKDHGQSPPKTESIEAAVEGRHLKMGIAGGGGTPDEMIYDGERREIVVVDHRDRSYFRLDEETMTHVAGQLNDAMGAMQEALENVPADQQAMLGDLLKGTGFQTEATAPSRPKTELRRTDQRADRSGYPCSLVEVLQDGRKVREMWVTDWSNVEGGDEVAEAFGDLAEFFKEIMDSMPSFGDSTGSMIDQSMFEHINELGGFPVVTRQFDDSGNLEEETMLRSARRQTIDPDAFEPPSGYKRQEMFGPS